MPIDFPNNPTTNQEFTSAGRTWIYDGAKWVSKLAIGPHAATHAAGASDAVTISQSQVSNLDSSLLGKVNTSSYDVAGKNKVINGGFDFWQRGTSFSNPAFGGYTADRWSILSDKTSSGITITQQAFPTGNAIAGYEPPYFLRLSYPTGGSYTILENRVEDVRTFAGQTVTLSFWAKCASGTVINAPAFAQVFGTGGSAPVDTILSATTVTTSWQRFSFTFTMPSIAGKTVGPNSSIYLRPFRTLDNPGATVDIWGVQLEAGSVATPFSRAGGTIQGELAACQRYFQVVSAGAAFTTRSGNSTIADGAVPLPVAMRTIPSAALTGVAKLDNPAVANYTQSSAAITIFGYSDPSHIGMALSNFTGLPTPGVLLLLRNDSGVIQLSAEV